MLYVLYNGYKKGYIIGVIERLRLWKWKREDYWGWKGKKKGMIFEVKKGRILVWMF